MKFTVRELSKTKARLGVLSDFPRLPGKSFQTPLLLVSTKGGSIPHITREVLKLMGSPELALQIPLTSTVNFHESLTEFESGINRFVGLEEHLSWVSCQDPAKETPQGYNLKNQIAIWTHSGKVHLDGKQFIQVMETFKPDVVEVIADGDTNLSSTKKRGIKAVDNSCNLLEDCQGLYASSKSLASSAFLGLVEGGYDETSRRNSVEFLRQQTVDGYVIDGLHNNGGDVEKIEFETVEPILKYTLDLLPHDKVRVLHGAWNPRIVPSLYELGIDVFDSSIVNVISAHFKGFVFKFEAVEYGEALSSQRLKDDVVDLIEDKYREDFSPILEGCECLTCRKYSRAYINHLANAKELLSYTLVMIHNLHHYLRYFNFIRSTYEEGKRVVVR